MRFSKLILSAVLLFAAPSPFLCPAAAEEETSLPASLSTSLSSSAPTAGQATQFSVSLQPSDAALASSPLVVSHERTLHVVGIGSDLDTFFHVHPEDFSLNGKMSVTFPESGSYLLSVNGAVKEGELHDTATVKVTGSPALRAADLSVFPTGSVTVNPVSTTAAVHRLSSLVAKAASDSTYTVTVAGTCTAYQTSVLTLTVHSGANKTPVKDLHFYLGAGMHLAVVDKDMTVLMHEHGMPPEQDVQLMADSEGSAAASTTDAPTTVDAMAGMPGMRRLQTSETPAQVEMAGMDMTGSSNGNGNAMADSMFGPTIESAFTVQKPGTYLLVAQLASGMGASRKVLWAPLRMECEEPPIMCGGYCSNAHMHALGVAWGVALASFVAAFFVAL